MLALSDISHLLANRSGQRETLLEILGVLQNRLGMTRGTIMLLTPDGSALEVAAAHSAPTHDLAQIRYGPDEGVIGHVLRSGRPLVVPSIVAEPRFRDRVHRRAANGSADASFICVPVLVRSEVVGTLAVDLPEGQRHWQEESVRLLTIVSSMIGFDVSARRTEREEHALLEAENLRLRDALEEQFRPENIIGNSRAMRDVYVRIRQVANADTTVLIRGESGTGKELAASAVHYSSPRAKGPFVRVNCSALVDSLLESELFGHEKGAFTGATQRRIGRIEESHGGTLFLDEIGEFSPALQVKLLRTLQEREFQRVGSNTSIKADVRIVAATNRDLEKAVADGTFRRDFYYRINVFPIHLPPLRDRPDDILLLANHFCAKYAARMNKSVNRISTPAINTLMAYHWPGNVRELENCIEHAVLLSQDGVIHSHTLPPTLEMPDARRPDATGSLDLKVQALERDMMSDALKRNHGNTAAAARELGTTARIFRYKMRKLGLP